MFVLQGAQPLVATLIPPHQPIRGNQTLVVLETAQMPPQQLCPRPHKAGTTGPSHTFDSRHSRSSGVNAINL